MRLSQERRNGALTPWRSYEWSVDDRLLAVVLNAEASGGNQAPRVTYGYHHSGTRVARSAVDGEAIPAPLRRAQNYLTDYNNPTDYAQSLLEKDPTERDFALTITTQRAFDQSGLLEADGAAGYVNFHDDNLGTFRGLTDAARSARSDSVTSY